MKRENYCLYLHLRSDNYSPFYVGIGKNKSRAYDTIRRNKIWKNIYNKHGFIPVILAENLSSNEAKKREVETIKIYKRISDGGILANITLGGDGSQGLIPKNADEFKEMLIKNNYLKTIKGKEEQRKRWIKYIEKNGNPMQGRNHSLESRKKMQLKSNKKRIFFGFFIYDYKTKQLIAKCDFLTDCKKFGLDPSNVSKKLRGISGKKYKNYLIEKELIIP